MSFLGLPREPVTEKDCEEALAENVYFDYWKGKVMKVDLSGDDFNPHFMTEIMVMGLLRKLLT